MERLTDNTGQLHACLNSFCAFEPQQICFDCKYQYEVNKKLAAYEYTGLTPEEVMELVRKKEQGLLVELPLKVGTTVYEYILYGKKPRIVERSIEYIIMSGNGWFKFETGRTKDFYLRDIGKTVFLTKEEAEKVLEEKSNGK